MFPNRLKSDSVLIVPNPQIRVDEANGFVIVNNIHPERLKRIILFVLNPELFVLNRKFLEQYVEYQNLDLSLKILGFENWRMQVH